MFHEAASCRIFGELPSVATTKFTAGWPFSLLGVNVAKFRMGEILDKLSMRATNDQRDDIVAREPNGFELCKHIFPVGGWQIAIW
jgi:hypothetical protein